MSEEIESISEYLRGMRDCANGIEADKNAGDDYISGYSAQYQHEQNMTEIFGHGN